MILKYLSPTYDCKFLQNYHEVGTSDIMHGKIKVKRVYGLKLIVKISGRAKIFIFTVKLEKYISYKHKDITRR